MLRDEALAGKTIVVTGGGSGLGKSMTKYFLELGANVAISTRNLEKLQNTASELEQETGGKCLPVQCDGRNYEEVEQMLKLVLDEFGEVDVLLNNAARNFISPTERLSANAFDTIIDIVLKGSKNCTLAFGKHWIDEKQENKNILNIVTTYAWTGSAYVVPSATAKAGVLAMTRSLAVEWAKHHINVNAIAPGIFHSEMADAMLERIGDVSKGLPIKRICTPEQMDSTLLFLVSPSSECVTGTCIKIDDGQSSR